MNKEIKVDGKPFQDANDKIKKTKENANKLDMTKKLKLKLIKAKQNQL